MQITLTVIEGPHQGQVFTFGGHDTFLVGRSKHAHLRLPHRDKYFSRIHFLMEVNPPRCRLVDMNSRNHTFVNGQKVTAVDLKDGDLITAGHTVMRIGLSGDAASEDALPPLPSDALGGAVLPAWPGPAGAAVVETPAVPTIKGYKILRELGRGGMGVVHLAQRLSDNSLVALKTIVPTITATPPQLERFLREANTLRKLDHPNIVRCLDVGESNGQLYFAMEYVPGTDAAQLVGKHGPQAIRTVVSIMGQLLKALEYAHEQQFVHRDIKPSNVLLVQREEGGEVKLADFGLARVYQASPLSGLTMTGDVGGSAHFMPPEQIIQYRDAKPPADQYAAAATMYNLLTDRFVYDLPAKVHAQFSMILNNQPVPIRSRRPEISEALAAVIHRALAREPQNRFADVKEFRKALLQQAASA